ncbi:BQ5605_C005g03362 [Microbotryum silenes-dioicae]|uniref:BQ5605_C005g03362 protein n=1 Tax=Microbotryum silenes-dioicae TaxID=796604 RepID=A0A2X0MAK8_9BASI|nr:BQ5605_C005g03362 [Microbotryum silenes-dioicae]
MASKQAAKRLSKEYQSMQKAPPPFVWARPNESNVLEWHYILQGPSDSPGEYWGTLLFPSDYPFAPPTIKMMTPSGRFAPSQAICTSMSSFHPSTWNPAWSVNTILVGLLSFMLGDEITTGAFIVRECDDYRSREASFRQGFPRLEHASPVSTFEITTSCLKLKPHPYLTSHSQQPRFKTHFPDYSSPVMKNLPVMGSAGPPAPTQSAAVNSTTTTTTTTVSTNGAALPVHSSSALFLLPTSQTIHLRLPPQRTFSTSIPLIQPRVVIDKKKDERKSKTRTWFLWAFVFLLVSWGVMKVLE